MYRCPPCINLAIPGEYRKIAENLFPVGGFGPEQEPDLAAASDFADALGIGAEYKRLLSFESLDSESIDSKTTGREMRAFLDHFQNNLDLLIQKTWVEKADEARKERLQDDIPGFMAEIIEGRFQQALNEFGGILEELAYLFFGTQSTKDDFTEYTFRIDTQIGLFWWYGGRLACLKELSETAAKNDKALWAVLLIGICYLTNF